MPTPRSPDNVPDRKVSALKTWEMLFFEADDLSMKIIEYYQRYLKRKGL